MFKNTTKTAARIAVAAGILAMTASATVSAGTAVQKQVIELAAAEVQAEHEAFNLVHHLDGRAQHIEREIKQTMGKIKEIERHMQPPAAIEKAKRELEKWVREIEKMEKAKKPMAEIEKAKHRADEMKRELEKAERAGNGREEIAKGKQYVRKLEQELRKSASFLNNLKRELQKIFRG